jgi:SAM-dependent methyltransferase
VRLTSWLSGGNPLPLPPKRMRFMGETDETFIAIGDHFVRTLERFGGFDRNARVLDVGCGYGRLAHALRRHGFDGHYVGLDVLKPHVNWCGKRLGSDRMRFQHVDVANERYNPQGRLSAHDVELADGEFDVVAFFSVFTHMWPEDVEAYMSFAKGKLAPSGRMVATFFLLDREWHRLRDAGDIPSWFPHERSPGCRYQSVEEPLHRVGYELDWVVALVRRVGLALADSPAYGTWSHRPIDTVDPGFQDTVTFAHGDDGRGAG